MQRKLAELGRAVGAAGGKDLRDGVSIEAIVANLAATARARDAVQGGVRGAQPAGAGGQCARGNSGREPRADGARAARRRGRQHRGAARRGLARRRRHGRRGTRLARRRPLHGAPARRRGRAGGDRTGAGRRLHRRRRSRCLRLGAGGRAHRLSLRRRGAGGLAGAAVFWAKASKASMPGWRRCAASPRARMLSDEMRRSNSGIAPAGAQRRRSDRGARRRARRTCRGARGARAQAAMRCCAPSTNTAPRCPRWRASRRRPGTASRRWAMRCRAASKAASWRARSASRCARR